MQFINYTQISIIRATANIQRTSGTRYLRVSVSELLGYRRYSNRSYFVFFKHNRTEQNRTEQNRTEQNRTEQNRIEQNRTEQNR
jgi:hypothetical protein